MKSFDDILLETIVEEKYLNEISAGKLSLLLSKHEDKIKKLRQMLNIIEPHPDSSLRQMFDFTRNSKKIEKEISKSKKIINIIKNRGI